MLPEGLLVSFLKPDLLLLNLAMPCDAGHRWLFFLWLSCGAGIEPWSAAWPLQGLCSEIRLGSSRNGNSAAVGS